MSGNLQTALPFGKRYGERYLEGIHPRVFCVGLEWFPPSDDSCASRCYFKTIPVRYQRNTIGLYTLLVIKFIIKITVKTVFFTEKFGDHGGKT